jgi:hypothetical protein
MTIPAGCVSRTRCFVNEASGTDALRIAFEEIARSAKVVIRVRHGAAGQAFFLTATAMQAAMAAAQSAARAGFGGGAGFTLRAVSNGAAVLAAMPPQAAGRHRQRNHREQHKNRAFHVRRFLLVRMGR